MMMASPHAPVSWRPRRPRVWALPPAWRISIAPVSLAMAARTVTMPPTNRSYTSRAVEAGRLQGSPRGPWPVVCARTGFARNIRGLVTDEPARSAAGRIQPDEPRGAVARFCPDSQPRRGLGHDQNRSDGAAVTYLPRVCAASALLPPGASRRTVHKANADDITRPPGPPRRLRTTSGVCSRMTGSTLCQRYTLTSLC